MSDTVGRTELHTHLDRMAKQLTKQIDLGFEGVHQRLDISNGRLGKAEDRIAEHASQLAVLLDRSNQSHTAAMIAATTAEKAATKAKVVEEEVKTKPGRWVQSAIATAVLIIYELAKLVWTAKGGS